MKVQVIAQGGPSGLSLAAAIKQHVLETKFDRLDVAVAYATLQGVKAMERILESLPPVSRWLVGLDDAVTQPEALDYLLDVPGAEVRIAKLSPARRFHPKLYRLWASECLDCSLLVIGSGNLTQNGLQENAEAGVLMKAESVVDARDGAQAFEELWQLGHTPTATELDAYRSDYSELVGSRKEISKSNYVPPEPLPVEGVGEEIPKGRTTENVIATAVLRIAAGNLDGVCSFEEARRRIPQMIALTADDLAKSKSQNNAKWVQRLRNIQSNHDGGPDSTNFIRKGFLEHIPGTGYRITPKGRKMLEQL